MLTGPRRNGPNIIEYIQAELEELANALQAVPKAATSGQAASDVMQPVVAPAVKALTGDGSKPWKRNEGAKAPCRFWGTDEGRRRGEKRSAGMLMTGAAWKNRRGVYCAHPKDIERTIVQP